MAKVLEFSEARPYFQLNGKEIYFFNDSPHLIKNVKSCLENSKNRVSFKSRLVSWSDIVNFYNKDSQNPVRCAPKLSDAHLFLNNFRKMTVMLAAQAFSNTVASDMLVIYNAGSPTFCNTVDYILFVSRLFDIFNSRNIDAVLPWKKIFSATPEQTQFLREAADLLKTIRFYDEKVSDIIIIFNYISGWKLNICSLQRLWQFLSHSGFTYLQTRRLYQYSLEHYFGQIRGGGGKSVRITPYMFSNLFKKLWGVRYEI